MKLNTKGKRNNMEDAYDKTIVASTRNGFLKSHGLRINTTWVYLIITSPRNLFQIYLPCLPLIYQMVLSF